MGKKHLRHYLVVVVAITLRGAQRLHSSCRPKLRVVVRALVRVAGGDGEHAEVLALHVVAALATGAALTIVAACSAGPAAQLLEIARVLAIGAVAVSAAVVLVRRARGSARRAPLRPLILATAQRVDSCEARVPAALALQLACDPRLLCAGKDPIRLALRYATRQALSHVATQPWSSVSRSIAPALDLLGACRSTLDSARFVRHFALTAVALSAEPSLLALS